MKSPLAAIRGAAELLQEPLPEADRLHFARSIVDQQERLTETIDKLLALVASDRQHVLRAEVFLADMADFDGMNKAWDEWVVEGATPARATVEAKLAHAEWKVEIVVTAAVP